MAVPIQARSLPVVVLSRDLGPNAVREARRQGLLQVARGVFTRPSEHDSPWQHADRVAMARAVGVSRRAPSPVVFSHRTAALIHGLWLVDADSDVHTTQPRRPSRTTPGLRRHVTALDPADVTEVNGLSTTTIERTIIDCAKTMHPRDALVVADSGMRALIRPRRDSPRRTAIETVRLRARLLTMVDTGDRRNRRQARAVVRYADPLAESPYETIIRWIGVSRGLPRPVLQPRYTTDDVNDYPDIEWRLKLWEEGRVVGEIVLLAEYDGEIKYIPDQPDDAGARRELSRRVMAERRRQRRLESYPGTTVERFDRTDVVDEERVFRRLTAPFPPSAIAALRPRPDLLGPPRER